MPGNDLLRQELATFEKHKSELLASADGSYALVHKDQVHGTFSSEIDAIAAGYERFGNVPFLVKLVTSLDPVANFVNNNLGL
jgi:hypothetical protein